MAHSTPRGVFALRAEALGAILISYCNRIGMPMPRHADKAIRIERGYVVLVLTLRLAAAPDRRCRRARYPARRKRCRPGHGYHRRNVDRHGARAVTSGPVPDSSGSQRNVRLRPKDMRACRKPAHSDTHAPPHRTCADRPSP